MPYSIVDKLLKYLEKECQLPPLERSTQIESLNQYQNKNGEEESEKQKRIKEIASVEKEIASVKKIQETWRKYKFQKSFFKNSYEIYIKMHDDDPETKHLSQMMFGKTLAPHKQIRVPTFIPKNPFIHPEALYYRTDPTYTIAEELKSIIPSYEINPDLKSYTYIPITISNLSIVEDIIHQYAPKHEQNITILKKENSKLGFIKIKKNDERFFFIKKVLAIVGLLESNFSKTVAGLGVKASLWQIAINTIDENHTPPIEINSEFKHAKKYLPNNLATLKNRNRLSKLISISKSEKIPTHHLAACLFNLVNDIPNDVKINKNVINRISLFIDSALNNRYDYDRFAFIMYCIIHEISMLLSKNVLDVTFKEFKQEAIDNAISAFDLPSPKQNSQYQYIALPANSGTNALILTCSLAQKAYQNGRTAVIQEGDLYFEFKNLELTKINLKDSTNDIYLISGGPTVWTGIHPGLDINKFIRSLIERSGSDGLKPTTIIIDATSAMYRHFKIDEDLKKYIVNGKLSILVHESHQKFGALHSEQLHYGRIFGIVDVTNYSKSLIAEFEKKATSELSENLDMKIGSYINIHSGKVLESIKEHHFRNGKYLRDFFENMGLQQSKIIPHPHNITDDERGLFVYGSQASSFARVIGKHLEHRGAFGHFNTTWTDCGPYYRISPSASDKIDILIEGSELYFAFNLNMKKLATTLKARITEMDSRQNNPTVEEQIMLAGLLQALKIKGYKPKSNDEYAIWEQSLKYMRKKCDKLEGRKCFHEILDYNISRQLVTAKLNHAIQVGLNNLSDLAKYVDNGADVILAINHINNKTSLKAIEFLVKELDKCTIHPSKISYSQISNQEVSNYLNKVNTILKLESECMSYLNYLTSRNQQEKFKEIDLLAKNLRFSDVNDSLNKFKNAFNTNNSMNSFKDDYRSKKFKRIVLAILSGGIYVAVRGAKIGTFCFWKSRREVYLDKAAKLIAQVDSKNGSSNKRRG
ncbi:MAG: hypothetical protein A3F11_02245 [Gammaproteobacteria bacterium RIFCSPHIGHO2_12_FULL_37_14]|nr:MAG: hypothetical protein A3F11_02245 [Gammaproteobacteria bacterium RIFCSPHIGHO2_12_FULL_37_14]